MSNEEPKTGEIFLGAWRRRLDGLNKRKPEEWDMEFQDAAQDSSEWCKCAVGEADDLFKALCDRPLQLYGTDQV